VQVDTEHIIIAENLTKMFGHFTAVDSISLLVKKGEVFGFLGSNGAGKTTTIKMLCGLLKPSSGQVSVLGYNVYKEEEKIKRNIGYMSQKFLLYEDLTVLENIRFYGGIYGLGSKEIKIQTEKLLDRLEIHNWKNSLIRSLPLGWKQKLAFLVSVIHQPGLVFLDEPTSGVDPLTRRQFWDMIYEYSAEGTTVVVTTHYMDEAEYCNKLAVMNFGKIVALDTPENLMRSTRSKNLDESFLKIVSSEK
jgi:ABC-2 type transport system ATP-binding protein